MREYKIAFFTADWNYELVESTLHGLKRFALRCIVILLTLWLWSWNIWQTGTYLL